MSVNKVIVIGNLGADPELRQTKIGRSVCKLRIATNRKWKDRDGNAQEATEWHSVDVWGPQGENCERYLSKGRRVFVEGRLQTDSWTDASGVEQKRTTIVAQSVRFLDRRDDGAKQAA